MLTPEERTNTKQDPTPDAQLEKLQLEIADLRWKVKWVYRVAQVTSIMVAIVAVFAFLWNLHQFNVQQKSNADAAAEDKQKETEAIDRELKKPVRERQLALALEISNVAATIATRPPNERRKAEMRFPELYWGPSLFIEDSMNIKEEMIEIVNCLHGVSEVLAWEARSDTVKSCVSEYEKSYWLKQFSIGLSNKLRGAIGLSWNIKQLNIYKGDTQEIRGLP